MWIIKAAGNENYSLFNLSYQRGRAGQASIGLCGCRVGRTQWSLEDRGRLNRRRWNGWGGARIHRHLFMDQGLSFIQFLLLRGCACAMKHPRKKNKYQTALDAFFSRHVHTVTLKILIHIHQFTLHKPYRDRNDTIIRLVIFSATCS